MNRLSLDRRASFRGIRANIAFLGVGLTLACSGTTSTNAANSGGTAQLLTGGSGALGGSASGSGDAGGTTSPTSATGGSSTGGTTPSAATGGIFGSGGSSQIPTTGGATAAGGGVGTGGVATGGALAGGAAATGGAKPSGGAATGGTVANATGGTKSSGGAATGGTKSTGGVTATGGTTGSAGNPSIGGSTGLSTTPITVWMAGDSTMINCGASCPCGWGGQLASYFKSSVTVSNSAVAGRSIQTWLYQDNVSSNMGTDGECVLTSTAYATRWTTMLNSMKAGDYLVIEFGINDTSSTCPNHVGTARYVALLGDMAQAAKAKGVTPLFLTPTSAIACNGSVARKTGSFLTETNTAGTANGVTVVDMNALTLALYNSLGLCPNTADYTSTTSPVGIFFCNDYIHFEVNGAKQVAGLFANALRTQGVALASYLL